MPTAIQLGLVPGFALQDGDKLANLLAGQNAGGFALGSSANTAVNLTSSSNNSATGATPIAASVTVVTTATTTGNSMQIPSIAPGTRLRVYNDSAQALHLFVPAGQTMDGGVSGGGVTLSGGARCDYLFIGPTIWKSDLLGTTSA